VQRCLRLGINTFDTAELYGNGLGEIVFGKNLKSAGVEREDLVITLKIHPMKGGKTVNHGLSRKHMIEGTSNSLQRLDLDYADILFLHRPDHETPIAETIRAANQLIDQDK
jgi:aryl-alcohol dehydrogenase-like predicted oxidoreductase